MIGIFASVTCFQEEEKEPFRNGYIGLYSRKVMKRLLCLKSLWNISLEIRLIGSGEDCFFLISVFHLKGD